MNAVFQVIYLTRLQCIKVSNVAGEREYTRITTPDTWFLGKIFSGKTFPAELKKNAFKSSVEINWNL